MPRPAWTLYAYQLIEADDQLDLFACREVRVHVVARQLELDTPADRTLCGKLLPAQPRWQPLERARLRDRLLSRLPETTGGGKAWGAPVLVGLSPPGETWRGVTLSFLLLHRTRQGFSGMLSRVPVVSLSFAALLSAGSASALELQLPPPGEDVVGQVQVIKAKYEDTFADLGEQYNLGYSEMVAANPGVDPWLPGVGTEVIIPTRFVLPPGRAKAW